MLLKELAGIAETYRRDARDVRRVAMKAIKADIKDGVVSEEVGKKHEQEMDKEVKRVSAAIDKVLSDNQDKLRASIKADED